MKISNIIYKWLCQWDFYCLYSLLISCRWKMFNRSLVPMMHELYFITQVDNPVNFVSPILMYLFSFLDNQFSLLRNCFIFQLNRPRRSNLILQLWNRHISEHVYKYFTTKWHIFVSKKLKDVNYFTTRNILYWKI